MLGRIVTTADPAVAASLPARDQAVRASLGSVACAVHAKGKTALEVANEIARAASAALPDRVEDFVPALRASLAQGTGRRFNVVIDALDEATDPEQAKAIVTKVILPMAETCADIGVQVIAGSRRSVGDVDLLAAFADSIEKLDLDDGRLFCYDDLASYVQATLRLEGDERDGNPYADEDVARPVAARIAELSDRNFLVAGLIARAHGLHDQHAADPASLWFTASVDAAMQEYLQHLAPVADVPAEAALTALAVAEAPGLPLELWRTAVQGLGLGHLTIQQLARFARTPAASYLVETSTDGGLPVFRLFHQALNDALLHARARIAAPIEDHREITRAFSFVGRQSGWEHAPSYLLRSLPTHAAAANLIDELLADEAYLLHADLRRLLPLADHASSEAGLQRSRLLRLTPRAIAADPATRTAMFSVTEILENLGRNYTTNESPAPYRAAWAAASPHIERAVMEGHTGSVNAVCAFTLDGRTLLASGGSDGAVRTWDPATGTEHTVLHGHGGWVNAVCAFTLGDRILLASGGDDRALRIWDPATGAEHAVMDSRTSWVNAVCAFTSHDRTMLASGGSDGAVRIWDPATGTEWAILYGHTGQVNAVCAFTPHDRTMLASGGSDGAVRIWDPATGTEQTVLHGHTGQVNAVCAFTPHDRTMLASGGDDRAVRIWDPATGTEQTVLHGDCKIHAVCVFTSHVGALLVGGGTDGAVRTWDPATGTEHAVLRGGGEVAALCVFTEEDRSLLASGSNDGAVRIWDPISSAEQAIQRSSSGGIRAVQPFTLNDRTLLMSGGDDGAVRIWDPATGAEHAVLHGHTGSVMSLCAFTLHNRTLLASGGDDGAVRIWDPATGAEHAVLHGHTGSVMSLCAFTLHGRTLLASGGGNGGGWTMRIWDPGTATEQAAVLRRHSFGVRAVCAFTLHGRSLLASGGGDGMLRIWDPARKAEQAVLHRHTDGIHAVCAFTVNGRTMLASGSDDRTIRVWDPAKGTEYAVLGGHTDKIRAIYAITLDGRTMLASGSDDRTIRIWDPTTITPLISVPVHHPVHAICCASDMVVAGTTAGLLAVQLNLTSAVAAYVGPARGLSP